MKKILCLVAVFLLILSTVVFALPQKPEIGNCSCGGRNVFMGASYGEWQRTQGSRVFFREVTEFYECARCEKQNRLEYREFSYNPDLPID